MQWNLAISLEFVTFTLEFVIARMTIWSKHKKLIYLFMIKGKLHQLKRAAFQLLYAKIHKNAKQKQQVQPNKTHNYNKHKKQLM